MQFNRSNLYYKPKGESEECSALPLCCAKNLHVMEQMDRYYLEHPTAGVLTMVNMLSLLGIVVNPKRVRRLLRKMNILPSTPRNVSPQAGVRNTSIPTCSGA